MTKQNFVIIYIHAYFIENAHNFFASHTSFHLNIILLCHGKKSKNINCFQRYHSTVWTYPAPTG